MEDKVLKGQVNTASKSSSSLQHNRWIANHYNNTEPSNTIFNHIHDDNTDNATLQASYGKALSFMSFDYREGSQSGEDIGNFLQWCISYRYFLLLRVLDLERVFRPQLPKVLSKLALLRYLDLRWTYLESLPSNEARVRFRTQVRVRDSAIFEKGGCGCGRTRRLKNY